MADLCRPEADAGAPPGAGVGRAAGDVRATHPDHHAPREADERAEGPAVRRRLLPATLRPVRRAALPAAHRLRTAVRRFEGRGVVVPEADCCLKALELAERAADEAVSEEDLRALAEAADALHHPGGDYAGTHDSTDEYEHRLVATSEVAYAIWYTCSDYPVRSSIFGQPLGAFENLGGGVWNTAQAAAFRKGLAFVQSIEGGDPDNMAVNAALLRDVVGNPFRPATVDPAWLTSTVHALAEGIYQERAFDRLPILADALEDAGCTDRAILDHLRGLAPHVRGCWAVDHLLNKA